MFRYLVPPKELHSLAMLARLSLVDLPFANSIKRCSPPASLNANNMKQTNRNLIRNCAYRLHAAERKIDTKVRNIGQQKCYNDLRKRRRSLAWHEQRASRLKNFVLVSARKKSAGRNYSGFDSRMASSARNAAVRNITRFAGGMRSSAAPAGIKRPSRLGRSCTAHICR